MIEEYFKFPCGLEYKIIFKPRWWYFASIINNHGLPEEGCPLHGKKCIKIDEVK